MNVAPDLAERAGEAPPSAATVLTVAAASRTDSVQVADPLANEQDEQEQSEVGPTHDLVRSLKLMSSSPSLRRANLIKDERNQPEESIRRYKNSISTLLHNALVELADGDKTKSITTPTCAIAPEHATADTHFIATIAEAIAPPAPRFWRKKVPTVAVEERGLGSRWLHYHIDLCFTGWHGLGHQDPASQRGVFFLHHRLSDPRPRKKILTQGGDRNRKMRGEEKPRENRK